MIIVLCLVIDVVVLAWTAVHDPESLLLVGICSAVTTAVVVASSLRRSY